MSLVVSDACSCIGARGRLRELCDLTRRYGRLKIQGDVDSKTRKGCAKYR